MAVTAKSLFEATQVGTAATTLYTAPAITKTIVDKFTATNTTATPATLTVYVVPSGGGSGVNNRIIAEKTVASKECYLCPEAVGQILNPGDFIVTETSAVAFTVRISGREIV